MNEFQKLNGQLTSGFCIGECKYYPNPKGAYINFNMTNFITGKRVQCNRGLSKDCTDSDIIEYMNQYNYLLENLNSISGFTIALELVKKGKLLSDVVTKFYKVYNLQDPEVFYRLYKKTIIGETKPHKLVIGKYSFNLSNQLLSKITLKNFDSSNNLIVEINSLEEVKNVLSYYVSKTVATFITTNELAYYKYENILSEIDFGKYVDSYTKSSAYSDILELSNREIFKRIRQNSVFMNHAVISITDSIVEDINLQPLDTPKYNTLVKSNGGKSLISLSNIYDLALLDNEDIHLFINNIYINKDINKEYEYKIYGDLRAYPDYQIYPEPPYKISINEGLMQRPLYEMFYLIKGMESIELFEELSAIVGHCLLDILSDSDIVALTNKASKCDILGLKGLLVDLLERLKFRQEGTIQYAKKL